MMKTAAVARGMVATFADASTFDAKDAVEKVQAAFEAFKETNAESVKAAAKGEVDILTKDKLDKIEADLGDVMQSIQSMNEAQAQAALGGADSDGTPISEAEANYSKHFQNYFRQGTSEAEVKAAIATGEVRAALSVGSDEDGGYTTPVEWDRTITDALKQVSGMRQYANVRNVSGRGFRRLYNIHGTTSGWVGETAARPNTNAPTLKPYDFAFGEIYANPAASQRILDDSEIDIEAWLSEEVSEEFAFQEGEAFINGDGVDKPRGLMTYNATDEAALPAAQRHPLGGIGEVAAGSAVTLTTNGLLDLIYDLPSARLAGASFYMNRLTTGLVRKMTDGDGNYIWQPPFQAGEPATLLGYGQRELLGMPDVATDALPVAFGNMAMTYSVFDRMGIRVLRDPYTNKPNVSFYSTKRVGGGLWNPEYMRFQKIEA